MSTLLVQGSLHHFCMFRLFACNHPAQFHSTLTVNNFGVQRHDKTSRLLECTRGLAHIAQGVIGYIAEEVDTCLSSLSSLCTIR